MDNGPPYSALLGELQSSHQLSVMWAQSPLSLPPSNPTLDIISLPCELNYPRSDTKSENNPVHLNHNLQQGGSIYAKVGRYFEI